ncbi:MAG: hypothetical protein ACK5LL_17335 [Suipraeoptans sp.]
MEKLSGLNLKGKLLLLIDNEQNELELQKSFTNENSSEECHVFGSINELNDYLDKMIQVS